MRTKQWVWPLAIALCLGAQTAPVSAEGTCGDVVTIRSHGRTTTAYSIAMPPASAPREGRAVLVLLPGGGGYMRLNAKGCPRKLKGNSLVRSRGLFRKAGFVTVLVDASSDHHGEYGLGAFRTTTRHAEDIGKVIAKLRAQLKLPVWLVGTSRGTISAVNAASRLTGAAAPDGLVLTSPITAGGRSRRKPWVSQTVFSLRLNAIHVPVLVVAHAKDGCIRTPPRRAARILSRTKAEREQSVIVKGPARGGRGRRAACKGRTSHGFLGQEAEVAAGMARFIHGGRY